MHPSGPAGPASDPSVRSYVGSGARWIKAALLAWADDDHEAIALYAPLAVEKLGKAALWKRNPSLLVPLTSNAEESLHILSAAPDPANPRLRTIGLSALLDRLARCLDDFPLDSHGRRHLVEVRNGSVHGGSGAGSRNVLRASLSVISVLLDDLGIAGSDLYGDQYEDVQRILVERRNEVQQALDARLAGARNRLKAMRRDLGPQVFLETCRSLEARGLAPFPYPSSEEDMYLIDNSLSIVRRCPCCEWRGNLSGHPDFEYEVDWDHDRNEDGTYTPVAVGQVVEVYLEPETFECPVCRLVLRGREELVLCGLPASRRKLEPRDHRV